MSEPGPGIQPKRQFTRVSDSDVYVSYPPKDLIKPKAIGKAPSVILILGWMDAQLSHLHKHTETYHQLYPSATQILVRTNYMYFWASEDKVKSYVAPVTKLLHDAGIRAYDPPESSGFLIHTFSNGGAMAQTTLARVLSSPSPPPNRASLPAQALIYDSLPATLSFRMTAYSFTTTLSPPPLRALILILLTLFWAVGVMRLWVLSWVKPELVEKEMFRQLHADLNDPKLVPQRVPRTYMYSDVDELSVAESVERHARVAKAQLNAEGADGDGLVKLEMFKGSPHVSHARKEPERYWGTVVRTWEASCRSEKPREGMLRSKL